MAFDAGFVVQGLGCWIGGARLASMSQGVGWWGGRMRAGGGILGEVVGVVLGGG